MEEIDRRIVQLLSADCRTSLADLALQIDLSTSALHQRIKRLEQRGVITGYRAEINYRAAGLPLTAFISAAPDDVPEKLAVVDQIEGCWSVAGSESYILKVRVAEPIDLEALLVRIRALANVSTKTTIVLSTPFENRPAAVAGE
jgi:Lrp/AsnC family leucine-responsive transcriptional regulator